MDQQTEQALDSILTQNAIQYAQDQFLAGGIGQAYLGLHRYPESVKESLFKWNQPSNVGNTGGASPKPHGTHQWTPGDPANFQCSGIKGQEDNFYVYMLLPTLKALPQRVVDIRTQQIPSLNIGAWQALEWQEQITLGGKIYNMAYQFSFTSGVRIYDKTDEKWLATDVSMPDFTNPVTTRCSFTLTPSGVTHDSIEIDGKVYPVGVTQLATPTKDPDKFTIAYQVDPKMGNFCSLNISQIDLRMV